MFDNMTEDQLRVRADELRTEAAAMNEEAHRRFLARMRLVYNCGCVRLNKDIAVEDVKEQRRQGRCGLTYGFVSESLSAEIDCPKCGGTGKVAGSVDPVDTLVLAARSEPVTDEQVERCVEAVKDAVEGRR